MLNRADTANYSDKLAFDSKSLDGLKQSSKDNSPESLKAAAKQFEALFMNMMLKSMRQAGGNDSQFDNEQSRMYTSMLDQQLTQNMSNKGMGLADALVRQLSNSQVNQALQADAPVSNANANDVMSVKPASSVSSLGSKAIAQGIASYLKNLGPTAPTPELSATQAKISTSPHSHVRDFETKLSAHAEEASRETGIPAKFMLGQAALESGWGKREIKANDGSSSHNVFGIKATSAWKGRTVDATTTEYVNGVPTHRVEKFKAYDSYADAFKDYAKLLTKNPRYEKVIANATDAVGFAQGLQKAGYATDPQYANKLTRIIKQTLSA